MKGNDCTILVRSRDLEKQLQVHVDKNCGPHTWTRERLRGTDSIQTNLRVNCDVIV